MTKATRTIAAMIKETLGRSEPTNAEVIHSIAEQVEEIKIMEKRVPMMFYRCRECGKHGSVNLSSGFQLSALCSDKNCGGCNEIIK